MQRLKLVFLFMAVMIGALSIPYAPIHAASSTPWKDLTRGEVETLFWAENGVNGGTGKLWMGEYNASRLSNFNSRIAASYNDPNYKLWLYIAYFPDYENLVDQGLILRTNANATLTLKDIGNGERSVATADGSMLELLRYDNTAWAQYPNGILHSTFSLRATNAAHIEPLVNPYDVAPIVPTVRWFQPWDGNAVISLEQLNSSAIETFLAFEIDNARYVAVAIDGEEEFIDWDRDAVYEKEITVPNASFMLDLSSTLKSIKSRLGIGNHKGYMILYNNEDWEAPEERDPTLLMSFDFKVVGTNGEIPPEGGYPDDSMPTAPKPPEDNWDVVGWLKYIFDWILYIFQIIGYMLGRIGEMITTGFGQLTGLTNAMKTYFSWLPPEITAILVMGLCVAVLIRFFGR